MNTVAPVTHAKLSASGADRWMNCPGSIELSKGMPDSTSVYAAEGTAAHELAQKNMKDFVVLPEAWRGQVMVVDGHKIEVTDDMIDAVNVYLNEIERFYKVPVDAKLLVEVDLTSALSKLHPSFGGISDCIIYRPKEKLLRVYDYKHGAGVSVEVEENTQLRYYALGALLTIDEPCERVEVAIVQPRCDHADGVVRVWGFDAVDLVDFQADLLDAAAKTEEFDADLNPGSWCRWCKASSMCPALEKHQSTLLADEFEVLDPQAPVPALTPEKLAEALDIIPYVEARITQLRELAYNMGVKGNPPPGYKIVNKRAMRKWADEQSVRETLAGVDECWTEPKPKSPAQCEKELGKKRYQEMIEEPGLVKKESSGYALVPVSDKRPPALLSSPDDFGVFD